MHEVIVAPLVLFLIFVMPVWIVLHYLTVWKRDGKRARSEKSTDKDLRATAEKLEQRLDAIESILDADKPDWREPE